MFDIVTTTDLGEESWKDLVQNPTKWWDNRLNKVLQVLIIFWCFFFNYFFSCLFISVHRGIEELLTLSTRILVRGYGSMVLLIGCFQSCRLSKETRYDNWLEGHSAI